MSFIKLHTTCVPRFWEYRFIDSSESDSWPLSYSHFKRVTLLQRHLWTLTKHHTWSCTSKGHWTNTIAVKIQFSEDHTLEADTICSLTAHYCCVCVCWSSLDEAYSMLNKRPLNRPLWVQNSPDCESHRGQGKEGAEVFDKLPGPGDLHGHLSLSHLVLHQDLALHLHHTNTQQNT